MKRVLVISSLFLTSCVALNETTTKTDKLDQENFIEINGIYSARPDSSWKPTLADFLIINYYLDHLSYEDDDTLLVELVTLNTRQIKVRVFRNKNLEFEKVLKGRLKNNYFVLNRQVHLENDLYGILKTLTRQRTRIGHIDNNLIVDSEEEWYSGILIFPSLYVKYEYYGENFKKIKNGS